MFQVVLIIKFIYLIISFRICYVLIRSDFEDSISKSLSKFLINIYGREALKVLQNVL